MELPLHIPTRRAAAGGSYADGHRRVSLIVAITIIAAAAVFALRPATGPPPARAGGVPRGLALAIHARLGPGPIGIGHAPLVAGIVADGSGADRGVGWRARAATQGLTAQISATGAVSAHIAGRVGVSLQPTGIAWGSVRSGVSVLGTSLRDGRLTERLVAAAAKTALIASTEVDAGGLEQSYTVGPPAGSGGLPSPTLSLSLSSTTAWRAIRGGSAIVPTGVDAGRLAYAGLRTTDAHGETLRSHFVAGTGIRGGVRIVVDTAGATYPITIDPTWTTTSTPTAILTETATQEQQLGQAVALSADGTTAIVGAPRYDGKGAVFVFHVSSEGGWRSTPSPVAELSNANGSAGAYTGDGDEFGETVALSADGTTALIGAFQAEGGASGTTARAGAAYIFHASSESAWTSSSMPTATLTDGTGVAYDELSSSLALSPDGTVAFVGDPAYGSYVGEVDVFRASSESTWATSSTPTATLTDGTGDTSSDPDRFGVSIAVSTDGTTALIGAWQDNDQKGAAFVFHVSSETAWATSSSPVATLSNGAAAAGDEFGDAVALSGDGTTALIGAMNVSAQTGAAYVFHTTAESAWASSSTPTATLTTASGSSEDEFGAVVALSTDGLTALVSSPRYDTYTGAAYIFRASTEATWATSSAPQATLTNSDTSNYSDLADATAISADGTTALLGAWGQGGQIGMADIYHSSTATDWATTGTPTAILTNGTSAPGDDFGFSVAISADGTTAVIGAIDADSGVGAAYVFRATSEGSWTTSSTPVATLSSADTDSDEFGSSVALSSDGTTALVGALGVADFRGAAYVFHVASEGAWTSTNTPTATLSDANDQPLAEFGSAVALSSDGTTALIGARGSSADAAYVFHVASEGAWQSVPTPNATLIDAGATDTNFGGSVALSADGTTALIGAAYADASAGAAFIFQAASEAAWTSTGTPTAELTNSSGSDDDEFGTAVALSGDGTVALVGAWGVNGQTGAAYIFTVGSETSWATTGTPAATLSNGSGSEEDYFGISAALSPNGTTALLGATRVGGYVGAAYVFQAASEGSWTTSATPTATLTNSAGASGDELGAADALTPDGETALVGAIGANNGGPGAVDVFSIAPATTTTTTTTTSSTSTTTSINSTGSTTSTTTSSTSSTTTTIPTSTTSTSTTTPTTTTTTTTSAPTTTTTSTTTTIPVTTTTTLPVTTSTTSSGGSGPVPPPPPVTTTTAPTTSSTTATTSTSTTTTGTGSGSGGGGAPPENRTVPQITGTAFPGDQITCGDGSWTGSPTRYDVQWLRGGRVIPGATNASYTVQITDEATALTCSVRASNADGTSGPATSRPVIVITGGPSTLTCPRPTGTASATRLGPLALGMSRAAARRADRRYTATGARSDAFCLYAGWGVRVIYASTSTPTRPTATGSSPRIVLALTANPFYAPYGIRPGERVTVMRSKVGPTPYRIGTSTWYVHRTRAGALVLRLQRGIVQDVGIASAALTATPTSTRRLLSGIAFPPPARAAVRWFLRDGTG